MFRGKNYKESAKLVEKSKLYEAGEAMELVTKTAKAKFDETVEVHIRLGVDSRHADQVKRLRSSFSLRDPKQMKLLLPVLTM